MLCQVEQRCGIEERAGRAAQRKLLGRARDAHDEEIGHRHCKRATGATRKRRVWQHRRSLSRPPTLRARRGTHVRRRRAVSRRAHEDVSDQPSGGRRAPVTTTTATTRRTSRRSGHSGLIGQRTFHQRRRLLATPTSSGAACLPQAAGRRFRRLDDRTTLAMLERWRPSMGQSRPRRGDGVHAPDVGGRHKGIVQHLCRARRRCHSHAITTLLNEVTFRFTFPFYPPLKVPTPRNRRFGSPRNP